MNGETSGLDRAKTISDIISTWVGLAALLIGAGWAVFEYRTQRAEARIEKTIGFFERWSEPLLEGSYVLVCDVFDDPKVEAEWDRLETLHHDDPDALSADKPLGQFILSVVNKRRISEPIYRVNDFFDALVACTDSNVCDYKFAKRLLCGVEVPFEQATRALTIVKRKKDPSYARGVTQFAAACSSSDRT
jgi:hypothetical protein